MNAPFRDRPSGEEAMRLLETHDLATLMARAAAIRDRGHGDNVSYSRKVFIPLTKLCRDSCHYCTFAHPPRRGEAAYLAANEVLAIARAGQKAGCKEALFTLGDQPELRYRGAAEELSRLGYDNTLSYLAAMAELVFRETGLLPHLNPGVMSPADIDRLRPVSVSMGLMLETAAERLAQRGGPHFGSPDKQPAVRLATIAAAGEAGVPFTSGILIGIGETRAERIDALLALRDLHDRYGHIQEIIVQNFRAKPGTRMEHAPEPPEDEHLWTISAARILLGPSMTIQAPPNLSAGALPRLIEAGINDWGGVSPVTPDHVNPEKPWPQIEELARQSALAGKILIERLAIYPSYIAEPERWLDPKLRTAVLRMSDSEGFARPSDWTAGAAMRLSGGERTEPLHHVRSPSREKLDRTIARAQDGAALDEAEIVSLFAARGDDFWHVTEAADALRREISGQSVGYVVNRNINYTNVCYYRCQFCAFSKGKLSENLRGQPYDLDLEEIRRRTLEAWDRGATEVCLQGGIHPEYTGATYLSILRAIKEAVPSIHVHAFSALEVFQGAATLGIPVEKFLAQLKQEGLGSLPGTAAEILDDEVRRIICPDKITTAQWLAVMQHAHEAGLRTTATIMFGHVDRPAHWARHLIRIRTLQARTIGFTEFVPLPFVPMETPIYLKGKARSGPTLRETVLMHAVARLALHPAITNIQTSWVKLGQEGVKLCLRSGANDIGGTLMNETISRAAGASHGQEMPPAAMESLIRSVGREPRARTTLYGTPRDDRMEAALAAAPLSEPVNTPARRYQRRQAAQSAS
jgi:FO synthase